jgi:hypothetical protein
VPVFFILRSILRNFSACRFLSLLFRENQSFQGSDFVTFFNIYIFDFFFFFQNSHNNLVNLLFVATKGEREKDKIKRGNCGE